MRPSTAGKNDREPLADHEDDERDDSPIRVVLAPTAAHDRWCECREAEAPSPAEADDEPLKISLDD